MNHRTRPNRALLALLLGLALALPAFSLSGAGASVGEIGFGLPAQFHLTCLDLFGMSNGLYYGATLLKMDLGMGDSGTGQSFAQYGCLPVYLGFAFPVDRYDDDRGLVTLSGELCLVGSQYFAAELRYRKQFSSLWQWFAAAGYKTFTGDEYSSGSGISMIYALAGVGMSGFWLR